MTNNSEASDLIMLFNIQGVVPSANSIQRWKIDYLRGLIKTDYRKYLIIALTETWLKPFMADAQISIEGFTVFRADRDKRGRGGALLYIRDEIPVTSTCRFDDDTCQSVFCCCALNKLLIACVYKPCDASNKSFSNLITFLQECLDNTPEVGKYTLVVLGDFNFPDLWTTASQNSISKSESELTLTNFMDSNFLCQYIDIATRQTNILDLFLTNNDKLVCHLDSEKHEKLSDHNIINITLPHKELIPLSNASSKYPKSPKLTGYRALDLQKADFNSIESELMTLDWNSLWENSNLESFPELFQKTVLNVCQKYSPLKIPNKPNKSADDRSYHAILRKKRKLKARLNCLLSQNPTSPLVKKLENKINKLLEDLKKLSSSKRSRREMKAIQKIKSNPKYFYSFAKKLSKTKQNISQLLDSKGNLQTDRKIVADILQDQFTSSFSDPNYLHKKIPAPQNANTILSDISFNTEDIIKAIDEIRASSSCPDFGTPAAILKRCKVPLSKPLYLMWNESLLTGKVPAYYKQQLITPVYKKGSRIISSNYRPVALTAHEIKIFERVIRSKVVDYLESKSLLLSKQHGFRKGKSCLTQLLKHYENVLLNLLDNNETDAIFLDYAKAFDKVDYDILFQKIKNIGISGKLFNWIKDFLSNRKQVVVVDEILSYIASVVSGVPQGTVLGPLLFLIFLNDIEKCIKSSELSCFADDTRICKSISLTSDCHLLQDDLLNIATWSSDNNMVLHEDKFVYLNFNVRHFKFSLQYLPFYAENFRYSTSTDMILERSETVKDLGITFSENLDWSFHVSDIAARAKKKAGWTLSVFRDRSPSVMLTLYKANIRSHLEYCCPLWVGLSQRDSQILESIQRSFTNKIICPPSVQNYWDRLRFLQLMSLQRRRERYVILHMWKIFHQITSNDLNITFYESARFGTLANVPPLSPNNGKAQTLYDSSFCVKGPQLWNTVPKVIRNVDTFTNFKVKLDIYLKSVPDTPPVCGYYTQNNNSLLEWRNVR